MVDAGRGLPRTSAPRPGALVVSLDFELLWGVRDSLDVAGSYRANLLGAREAVPRMLDLFDSFGVAATWATVGFLFAESGEELQTFLPAVRPAYADRALDPYVERVGRSELEDPLRLAPSLVRAIAATPRQEVATHTFSHFYALEPGQDRAAFEADLGAAVAIARARGIELRSIVFPRNQVRDRYLGALPAHGIVAFRGAERSPLHRPSRGAFAPPHLRAARLADTYVPLTGSGDVPWPTERPDGLVDVPASRFLRPGHRLLGRFEASRVARIVSGVRTAARRGTVFHLWWHPHNVGVDTDHHMAVLRRVLTEFARARDEQGMVSLSMADVAASVRRPPPSNGPAT